MVIGTHSGTLKRRLALAEIVRRQGEMRVDELAQMLGVSAVTIRSDLNYLEEQGLLIRSFGKALAANQLGPKFSDNQPAPNKARFAPILRHVAGLVHNDGPLLIGRGTLAKQIIPLLNGLRDLQLVVSDIDAVSLGRQCLDCTISLLAGTLEADGTTLGGPKTIQSLKCELIDTYICEARALHADGGLFIDGYPAAEFASAASRHARQTIVLVHNHNLTHSRGRAIGDAPLLSFSHIGIIAFAEPPDTGCRELLTRCGFGPLSGGAIETDGNRLFRQIAPPDQ